jgi:hypothetical protein
MIVRSIHGENEIGPWLRPTAGVQGGNRADLMRSHAALLKPKLELVKPSQVTMSTNSEKNSSYCLKLWVDVITNH